MTLIADRRAGIVPAGYKIINLLNDTHDILIDRGFELVNRLSLCI